MLFHYSNGGGFFLGVVRGGPLFRGGGLQKNRSIVLNWVGEIDF